MVVRDRLKQLQVIYAQHEDEANEDDTMLGWEEEIKDKTLPFEANEFLQKITNIHQRLDLTRKLIDELQQKQSEILTSATSTEILNEERDQMIATIKELTSYIHHDIKLLEKEAEQESFDWTVEDKIKRDQVNVLFLMFQDVMIDYNNKQMVHRANCKARIQRQLEISGSTKTSEEIEEMIETGNTNVFHQELLLESTQARDALRDAEERHYEILKLERSITELFEIFQEIACMIDIQGNMIDNIERNVQQTAESVHTSTAQMKRAYKYKRRKLATLCCPCLSFYRMCSIL